ncbi:PKD domain-containing protein [Sulfurimonas sp. HSL-3221]|uniref:PKD domain-containing protein n=1 Tax=Sulfurimonadaceae TaxID=2771471 RepID=UPI001E426907|nr:PKD domain-containing protein [Sulfurimonas sp. HSL-3221]UFS63421.1 PKD domain-containing protein [Sulfurimonas sp. HSL-3221]
MVWRIVAMFFMMALIVGCGGGSSDSKPTGELISVSGAWDLTNDSSCSETIVFYDDATFMMTSGDWNATGYFNLLEKGERDLLSLYIERVNGKLDCDNSYNDISGFSVDVYASQMNGSVMYWFDDKASTQPFYILNYLGSLHLVADAGSEQYTIANVPLTLVGMAKSDHELSNISYHWSVKSQPVSSHAVLSSENNASTTFSADTAGIYICTLTVTNDTETSVPAEVKIVVTDGQPVANAGPDQMAIIGDTVILNGQESMNPMGTELTYVWNFVSKPLDSTVELLNASTVSPSFVPDESGDYRIALIVDNGTTTSVQDTVDIYVSDGRATAKGGPDQNGTVGDTVVLNGLASVNPMESTLTYQWNFVSKPLDSTVELSNAATVSPSFVPDKPGDYRVALVVDNGMGPSEADTVDIFVSRVVHQLDFYINDAEYSQTLDKIVFVSSEPVNALYIYDPLTQEVNSVNLPIPPNCVSIGPDGLFAAVGHDAYITYVDLAAASAVKTFAVSADVLDVVLDGNGYVHAFPRDDQWVKIRTVQIETEQETLSTGLSIYAGTVGKLHPDGASIYGADNGIYPADIEKYDISGSTADYLYDSPYHGDYQMCGDLWISEDGFRIFTKCGNVFRASSQSDIDMTYNGSLQDMTYIRSLSHSAESGKIALVPQKREYIYYYQYIDHEENMLYLFDDTYLAFEKTIKLPNMKAGNTYYQGNGRYVFFNSDGSICHVVLQAAKGSGMLYDFGVVSYDMQ